MPSSAMFLDDVLVPQENMLGGAAGWKIAMHVVL
jgi:alkylation response protein AidB-like acyl-CoA dehydrogenase